MDITQALAQTLRAVKGIRKATHQQLADAAGITRYSVMRKLDGTRETTIAELRGFAQALDTSASALMAVSEAIVEDPSLADLAVHVALRGGSAQDVTETLRIVTHPSTTDQGQSAGKLAGRDKGGANKALRVRGSRS